MLARVVEVASGMPFDRFTKQRVFDPLGMKDTFFYPATGNPRIATLYQVVDGQLRKQPEGAHVNGAYFSGGGGLFSTAEDYLQFALMLMNGGQHEGKRLLSTRTVEMMSSVFAPDTLPGRPAGEGWGLSMRVVTDPARSQYVPVKGQLRVERRVQHALLHRSEGKDRRNLHDAVGVSRDARVRCAKTLKRRSCRRLSAARARRPVRLSTKRATRTQRSRIVLFVILWLIREAKHSSHRRWSSARIRGGGGAASGIRADHRQDAAESGA